MHIDEVEIFEPLENSNLKLIVPKDDKILYSAIFEIFERYEENEKWRSPVILTDKGIAFESKIFIPIQNGCGEKSGDFYYFPWHAVHKARGYSTRIAIGNYHLRIEPNKEIIAIKPIDVLDKEMMGRSEILIKKSKDELYEKLFPILKSFPKRLLPLYNTSKFSMNDTVYTELRSRYTKKVGPIRFNYRSKIKPIHKKTYYSREKIIDEVRNFNLEQGTYDAAIKAIEMAIVYANYFGKHSIEESTDLMMKLFEINTQFVSKWFPQAKINIIQQFPKKEKILYELERAIVEIIFKLIFEDDEHLITDFKGTVSLREAYLVYPGHVYLTNYQLLIPNIPKDKILFSMGKITGLIAAGVKSIIKKARKKLFRVLQQNPDMFYIKNPYDIKLQEDSQVINIHFAMNIDYKDKRAKSRIYKLIISIKINKFKSESLSVFKQKKKEVVSKFTEFFSKFPNTVCPKCSNVQDKNLKKCEKCGKKLKIQF